VAVSVDALHLLDLATGSEQLANIPLNALIAAGGALVTSGPAQERAVVLRASQAPIAQKTNLVEHV